jgi:hypothetical protein
LSETALAKTTETAPAKSDSVELLRKKYENLQGRDLDVVRTMNRFAELPSGAEAARQDIVDALNHPDDSKCLALGFKTKRELRIALYGTLPKKDWPASMQSAHERVMARIRKQGQEKRTNTFNLNIIQMPAPVRPGENDRIITIKAEEPPK